MVAIIMIAVCIMPSMTVEAKKKSNVPSASQYAAVFNASFYAAANPDVAAVVGTSEQALFSHFYNCGMTEGRQGSEEFNVRAYKARYTDLAAVFGDDLRQYYVHYVTSGKAEGRNGRASAAQPQAAAPAPAPAPAPQPVASSSYQDQVVALVNQDRAANGLGPVTATAELNAAAQARANEIVSYFSHTRPNGSSCFTIFREYGVNYGSAGENIAAGQRSPEAVENSWMNSSGHRANILNGSYAHIGVGYVNVGSGYGSYWVQMFTN